jgi:hypothetical protein
VNDNNLPINLGHYLVLKETDEAILVTNEDEDPEWIPKNVVHYDSEIWKEDQFGYLVVEQWFAEKQGWI